MRSFLKIYLTGDALASWSLGRIEMKEAPMRYMMQSEKFWMHPSGSVNDHRIYRDFVANDEQFVERLKGMPIKGVAPAALNRFWFSNRYGEELSGVHIYERFGVWCRQNGSRSSMIMQLARFSVQPIEVVRIDADLRDKLLALGCELVYI